MNNCTTCRNHKPTTSCACARCAWMRANQDYDIIKTNQTLCICPSDRASVSDNYMFR
jgi:hypothetical protein